MDAMIILVLVYLTCLRKLRQALGETGDDEKVNLIMWVVMDGVAT